SVREEKRAGRGTRICSGPPPLAETAARTQTYPAELTSDAEMLPLKAPLRRVPICTPDSASPAMGADSVGDPVCGSPANPARIARSPASGSSGAGSTRLTEPAAIASLTYARTMKAKSHRAPQGVHQGRATHVVRAVANRPG